MNPNEINEDDNQVTAPDELTSLKDTATKMGIQFHPNIGVEKLRARIREELGNEGLSGDEKTDVTSLDDEPTKEEPKAEVIKRKRPKLTPQQVKQQQHQNVRRDAFKLIRCRISCMNPNKKNWTGEVLSVSNAVIGTIKKFVPYNSDKPYHLPNALYRMLKERKYQHFTKVKLPKGGFKQVSSLLNEFSIEVLPPLTAEEMKNLKQRQLARKQVGEEV